MSGRFFMRFNLHSSVGHFPVTCDIFERLLPYDRSELQRDLDDFEAIQAQRIKKLKSKYANEIEKIKNKKVLFFGDSISSDNLGYRISVTRAAELEAYDATVSGGTSSMMIQDAKATIQKICPDIVSIMIGTNDSVSTDGMHIVSIEEYERNVRALLRWSRQIGARILLFEIPPISEKAFNERNSKQYKTQSNENIKKYNSVLKKLADELNIQLIPHKWMNGNEDMFEPDAVHLSVKAQENFAESWLMSAAQITENTKMR